MSDSSTPRIAHRFHTPRACFLLTGGDRVRYLNGQITNQVDNLPVGQARYATITNHKGQLEADLYFTYHPELDGILIDTDGSLQESFFTRLDRYIIADDVELSDVTADWQIVHLLDPEVELADAAFLVKNNRFGWPGVDAWFPASQDLDALLQAQGIAEIEPQALERQRIAHGTPLWNHELTPGLLPPEARLEARAIDYQKGCYIGQEVISRIKSAGKVNRLLVLLRLESPEAMAAPSLPLDLWPDADAERSKPIGTLTSLSQPSDSSSEVLALGYLKRQHAEPGTHVLAGSSTTSKFTVLPFPE